MKPSQNRLVHSVAVLSAAVGGLAIVVLGQRRRRVPEEAEEASTLPLAPANRLPVGTQHPMSVAEPVDNQTTVGIQTNTSLPSRDMTKSVSSFTRAVTVIRAAVTPLTAVSGLVFWTLAQARLLESRHPVVPLLFYVFGLALVIPALVGLQDQLEIRRGDLSGRPHNAADTPSRWLTWDVLAVLALMLVAAVMQSQVASTLTGLILVALLVPAVYMLGRALDAPLTGTLAAAFVSVSAWPLALANGEPLFLILAGIGGIGLALLCFGFRQWVGRLMVGGAILILLTLFAALNDFAETSWTQAEAVGLSPVVTLLDSLSASLLMFNLTGDPNVLRGLANRPVFAPSLSALFVFGLVAWVVRLRRSRRWMDAFPLVVLVVALLPSALSVHYPDAQRAALALPVAVFFAAYGAAAIVRLLTTRFGSLGAGLALWLVLAVLVFTVTDAVQSLSSVALPAINSFAP